MHGCGSVSSRFKTFGVIFSSHNRPLNVHCAPSTRMSEPSVCTPPAEGRLAREDAGGPSGEREG